MSKLEEIKKLKAVYFRLLGQKHWEEWADIFAGDATVHLGRRRRHSSESTGKGNLPPVSQIGIIVKDVEKMVQFYFSAYCSELQ
ncbi:MAG: nuclear transport factor 2 family protein [Dehalococcoidia bacterium]|nr:nuclear transport factor 2 family protein [Dehalococcoidia bacterium]